MDSYKDHLKQEFLNQNVVVHQRYPVGGQGGDLGFPGVDGILTGVFEDGVSVRRSQETIFVSYERIEFIRIPSKVALA
jgi:hypothetical protein